MSNWIKPELHTSIRLPNHIKTVTVESGFTHGFHWLELIKVTAELSTARLGFLLFGLSDPSVIRPVWAAVVGVQLERNFDADADVHRFFPGLIGRQFFMHRKQFIVASDRHHYRLNPINSCELFTLKIIGLVAQITLTCPNFEVCVNLTIHFIATHTVTLNWGLKLSSHPQVGKPRQPHTSAKDSHQCCQ